ncbi:MAG: hypothetical protein IPP19_11105 [Verrucomicrobia bacterium]|nr:hypothetical protein [Verrucomicrobiota bacterium]
MLRRLFFSLLLTLPALTVLRAGTLPPELDRALKLFRAEGAPNWAYIQTTESGDKTLVEHFDPSKPEFSRWTLLKKNGAAPNDSNLKEYRDRLSRRTSGTAPNVKDQIDHSTCELLSDEIERATYRFRLQTGEKGDRSAAHMNVIFTLHKGTGVIERVELSAFEPFSPMFTVKITEAKTTMLYSLPTPERPALLQQITMHIRGRAMWFKSLDADMVVTYSEHTFAGKRAVSVTPSEPENPARPAVATP